MGIRISMSNLLVFIYIFSGYPNPEKFSWTEYLEATQTNAVPAKVFKMVSSVWVQTLTFKQCLY